MGRIGAELQMFSQGKAHGEWPTWGNYLASHSGGWGKEVLFFVGDSEGRCFDP